MGTGEEAKREKETKSERERKKRKDEKWAGE